MPDSAAIKSVSDTALWVATFRAQESARPDAAFRDPLAALLAGERGPQIANKMAYRNVMMWIMVMRTVGIDRLISEALAEGVDTVVNLGAGLDTRPYRMELPATLRWVEVDFPEIIGLKNDKLRNETPKCRLERIILDLSLGNQRRERLAAIGASSRKVLFLTEGVIPYLSNDEAASLADDLAAVPNAWGWIQDFNNSMSRRRLPTSWTRKMKAAPFRFVVPDWFAFFTARGWQVRKETSAVTEAETLGRPFPFLFPWSFLLALMPKRRRLLFRKMSGCVLFTRA